jgi:hypothetical protein
LVHLGSVRESGDVLRSHTLELKACVKQHTSQL